MSSHDTGDSVSSLCDHGNRVVMNKFSCPVSSVNTAVSICSNHASACSLNPGLIQPFWQAHQIAHNYSVSGDFSHIGKDQDGHDETVK